MMDRHIVKVVGMNDTEITDNLKDAFKIAQEELLKHNLKHSYARITWTYGLFEKTELTVNVGADYSRPRDAISHGYPFIAKQNGSYMGKLNLDGTFVKEVKE